MTRCQHYAPNFVNVSRMISPFVISYPDFVCTCHIIHATRITHHILRFIYSSSPPVARNPFARPLPPVPSLAPFLVIFYFPSYFFISPQPAPYLNRIASCKTVSCSSSHTSSSIILLRGLIFSPSVCSSVFPRTLHLFCTTVIPFT
jgi:hypothetical protein